MRTAKKAALGALAASVMALVTPLTPASADPGDTFTHGCGFDTNQQDTVTNGENQGVIYVAGISQEASGLPSTATVSCWIDVNGVEQPGTRLTTTGTGVIVNSQQITFNSIDGDSINECQQVTFADGSTWVAADGNVGVDCPAATEIVIPPKVVTDLLDNLFITVIDPLVCPVLVTLGQLTGGGVAGVVTIGPDGDLSIIDPLDLGINPIEDCPPYLTA